MEAPAIERPERIDEATFTEALRIVEADPHQWSFPPCVSCRAVSKLLGQPFGCEARAKS